MDTKIIYEQPLTERIRGLLRLEHLFESIANRIDGDSVWDTRACLIGFIDIIDVLSRSDVKAELIKEAERRAKTLNRFREAPGVDSARLDGALAELDDILRALRDNGYDPGRALRKDELLFAVKQRSAIAGGTCSFDLPAYHYWLNQAIDKRREQLRRWLKDLDPLSRGVDLVLRLTRESATPAEVVARDGFYQQDLDPNGSCQLVRLVLPAGSGFFPEVSGGRHRFTVRFLSQPSTQARPSQTSHDVRFELQCCTV